MVIWFSQGACSGQKTWPYSAAEAFTVARKHGHTIQLRRSQCQKTWLFRVAQALTMARKHDHPVSSGAHSGQKTWPYHAAEAFTVPENMAIPCS
ncbi:hypothetical protein PoB_006201600 [Plakobranchus ocellatus]|uniref:Uncharacterized protein n=1 Tax=Plakobranchus ocellatus TaxID=259542 RepID=A0AAV4CUH8_9GAST|nr:hypothetical protein PoB_006201600 [Plakobranchus ocellatus]